MRSNVRKFINENNTAECAPIQINTVLLANKTRDT